jgi:hypothetical protein
MKNLKKGIYKSLTIYGCQEGTTVSGWRKLDEWETIDRDCVLLTNKVISQPQPLPKRCIGMVTQDAMEKLFP